MSLQLRLSVVFVCIVFLPLAVAGYFVQRIVVGEFSRRTEATLGPALDATVSLYNERVESMDEHVRAAAGTARFGTLLQKGNRRAIDLYLERSVVATQGLDFLLALGRDGKLLAHAQDAPEFVGGFDPPTPREILASGDRAVGFDRTAPISVRLPNEGLIGRVVGGFWLDEELLIAAARQGVELSLADDGRVFASTVPLARPVRVDVSTGGPSEIELAGPGIAVANDLSRRVDIIASSSAAPVSSLSRQVVTSMLVLLAVALIVTSLLAWILARQITQPIDELSKGAQAIAAGDLDYRIPVMARDEVGRLAGSFNEMTEKLESTIHQLQASRDQLQRAIRRVGDVLRSRNDIRRIFDSILNTAADAVDADAAILWYFTGARNELTPVALTGVERDDLEPIELGEGIVGLVAERGRTVMLDGKGRGPKPARKEPTFPVALAVPLVSDDRIRGVVAVYRRDAARSFIEGDLETVIFLAEQGGVAIENVALHEEAQRLSLTDGLTGTYNRRYFQMQFRQVLATATRFDRPFSVLMMDLDHFKRVNDTFGHQRGDEILVDFSKRVAMLLREVDTFARYGGEEFICLLSETDVQGALTTAEKIREAIRAEPFGERGQQLIELTVSIGVASYPEHGQNYRSLVEAADKALYQAKQTGRDRVSIAGQGPSQLKLAK